MGGDEGNQAATGDNKRSEAVVSVRFAASEVTLLRQLADAQNLPLSTVIRRAALASATNGPVTELVIQMNQGGAGSAWVYYDFFSSQLRTGSQQPNNSTLMNYLLPSPTTVL